MYISVHKKEHLDLTEKSTDHPETLGVPLDAVTGLHFGLSCLRIWLMCSICGRKDNINI